MIGTTFDLFSIHWTVPFMRQLQVLQQLSDLLEKENSSFWVSSRLVTRGN
jgi:hypothetical protein